MGHNLAMTATFVLVMVVVVSGVLLGCVLLSGRRAASAHGGTANPGDGSTWIPAVMSDGGGGSDCSAGDAGCGDGGGGGGGD